MIFNCLEEHKKTCIIPLGFGIWEESEFLVFSFKNGAVHVLTAVILSFEAYYRLSEGFKDILIAYGLYEDI